MQVCVIQTSSEGFNASDFNNFFNNIATDLVDALPNSTKNPYDFLENMVGTINDHIFRFEKV